AKALSFVIRDVAFESTVQWRNKGSFLTQGRPTSGKTSPDWPSWSGRCASATDQSPVGGPAPPRLSCAWPGHRAVLNFILRAYFQNGCQNSNRHTVSTRIERTRPLPIRSIQPSRRLPPELCSPGQQPVELPTGLRLPKRSQ